VLHFLYFVVFVGLCSVVGSLMACSGVFGVDDSVYGNEVQGAAMGALHFEEYFFSASFSFCCFVRKDVFGNV